MASEARLIRERLALIVADVSGIVTVLDGTEPEISIAMLPAVRVLPGRVLSRQSQGAFGQLVTRNFRFLLYTSAINAINADEDELTDITAAEDWLDVLPTFWRQRQPRLRLTTGADISVPITDVGVMTGNDQPAWLKYQRQGYTGVVNDLPITYRL